MANLAMEHRPDSMVLEKVKQFLFPGKSTQLLSQFQLDVEKLTVSF